MNKVTNQQIQEVTESIGFYRGIILDIVEQEISDQECWFYLRSRLLRALGEKGLEGRISAILIKASADISPYRPRSDR